MRVFALLVVLAVLATGPAASQSTPLEAAVAPVQTAVDAAGAVVTLALPEASRDGTPDEAWALRERLLAFVAVLDRPWGLPEAATYRSEVLAALPYAQQAADAARAVPDDAAEVARIVGRCEGESLTVEQETVLLESSGRLEISAAALALLAADAPAGVDARPLADASTEIRRWLEGPAAPSTCMVQEGGRERPVAPAEAFLRFSLFPETTWPGGDIRVVGLTNADSVVDLGSEGLSLQRRLVVTDGRFELRHRVPEDTPLGEHEVTAVSADLRTSRPLTLDRAPATLTVTGPGTAQPGETVLLQVVLSSPLPSHTDEAVVRIGGDADGTIELVGGVGTWSVRAPETGGSLLRFEYAGHPLVQPAAQEFSLRTTLAPERVAETTPPEATPPVAGPLGGGAPLTWVIGAVAAVTVLLAMVSWWRNRRPAPMPAAAAPTSSRSAALHRTGQLTLIGAFASIVRLLRSVGQADASTTAREAGESLRGFGVDSTDVVRRFELERYGEHPEDPSWLRHMSTWIDTARRRILEVRR